jgi:hypothetical protein
MGDDNVAVAGMARHRGGRLLMPKSAPRNLGAQSTGSGDCGARRKAIVILSQQMRRLEEELPSNHRLARRAPASLSPSWRM